MRGAHQQWTMAAGRVSNLNAISAPAKSNVLQLALASRYGSGTRLSARSRQSARGAPDIIIPIDATDLSRTLSDFSRDNINVLPEALQRIQV